MTQKKYPFRLDDALKGEPVINGLNDRVMKITTTGSEIYTHEVITESGSIYTITNLGRRYVYNKSIYDLYMLTPPKSETPTPEVKKRWFAVEYNCIGGETTHGFETFVTNGEYPSRGYMENYIIKNKLVSPYNWVQFVHIHEFATEQDYNDYIK